MTSIFTPAFTLAWREWIRFYRQRSRIIGSLLTPLLFWLFLGTGLGAAFSAPNLPGGKGFIEYFFPGNLALTILFTSIFSSMSLIEDRREGFLQSVLVAPLSRTSIVLGKVFGGTFIALFQGILFLLLAPLAGLPLSFLSFLLSVLSLFSLALTLSALGFFFAWWFNSSQGFHSVMNLLLFPMWLLSGAFFPVSNAPYLLKPLVWLNPMTYGLSALMNSLYFSSTTFQPAISLLQSLLISFVFGSFFVIASLWVMNFRRKAEVTP